MICTFNIFQSQILIRGFQLVHVLSAATEKYVEGLLFVEKKENPSPFRIHRVALGAWYTTRLTARALEPGKNWDSTR